MCCTICGSCRAKALYMPSTMLDCAVLSGTSRIMCCLLQTKALTHPHVGYTLPGIFRPRAKSHTAQHGIPDLCWEASWSTSGRCCPIWHIYVWCWGPGPTMNLQRTATVTMVMDQLRGRLASKAKHAVLRPTRCRFGGQCIEKWQSTCVV